MSGMESSLWAGRHLRVLDSWESDVANEAAVSDPQVESVMDGVHLLFLPIEREVKLHAYPGRVGRPSQATRVMKPRKPMAVRPK